VIRRPAQNDGIARSIDSFRSTWMWLEYEVHGIALESDLEARPSSRPNHATNAACDHCPQAQTTRHLDFRCKESHTVWCRATQDHHAIGPIRHRARLQVDLLAAAGVLAGP